VSRSSACNTQQPLLLQAPNDIVRYTTEELLSIATQHATSKEATGPPIVLGAREVIPGDSKAASSGITI
jgi:hypothetical protein